MLHAQRTFKVGSKKSESIKSSSSKTQQFSGSGERGLVTHEEQNCMLNTPQPHCFQLGWPLG